MELSDKEQKYVNFINEKIRDEIECYKYYYVAPWERVTKRYKEIGEKNLKNYLIAKYGVTDKYVEPIETYISRWLKHQGKVRRLERLSILHNRIG